MDYLDVNKKAWNARTLVHVTSKFYDVNGFLNGNTSLKHIELAQLKNVSGKKLLHLQCHFGLDTLSLARMGANVTGVDLSDIAITKAGQISLQTGLTEVSEFICNDVYTFGSNDEFEQKHRQQYDIVFVSYGAVCWLPDINRWAKVVADSLKVGGYLHFVEFHPAYDLLHGYNYFTQSKPDIDEEGTYTENGDNKDSVKHKMATWSHPISGVLTALINNGLQIQQVQEYDYSPYNCFDDMIKRSNEHYCIEKFGHYIPLTWSLVAKKHFKKSFVHDNVQNT